MTTAAAGPTRARVERHGEAGRQWAEPAGLVAAGPEQGETGPGTAVFSGR